MLNEQIYNAEAQMTQSKDKGGDEERSDESDGDCSGSGDLDWSFLRTETRAQKRPAGSRRYKIKSGVGGVTKSW